MEIAIGIIVVTVILVAYSQMSLDKPVASWTDEELVRRLRKYKNLFSAELQAGNLDRSKNAETKIDEIHAEIINRQIKYEAKQAEPLKQKSLLGEKDESVITEAAISAADAGNVELQALVGATYLSGANGLPQDLRKAASYLLGAANSGHAYASFVVAGMYADGLGLQQDFDNARLWAAKAKALGAVDADQMIIAIDAKRTGRGSEV